MIGKKINQLATELAPVSTDLTIIGDPISGVSKKITLAQLGAIFSGAVSFYNDLASFPATGDINVIYCAKDTQKLYLWSGSAYTEVFPSQALLDTYQLRSEKGVSNGYASLDSAGKVPISQLPSSIMEYKGTWSASTNTPTLANGTGDTGDVYICNSPGSVNFGAGAITFAVGDYVIYSGSIWQRSSGAVGTVTSVAASITGNSIGITGSPVTTSGTLAFAFAGTGAQYIKGDGTLATFPSTIAQAERLITEVYNSTGATLTKGTIVYINGGQGNLPTVTKALATGDSTSAQTFGVVQADITNNNNGYVVVAGKLSDLDTQAYTEGTQLYLSATTAGTWTSTKQYAPNHLVYVGIVVRAHPTQGIVEIKIQNGYEMDELHNVAAQTPTNNDGLFWESATSLWKNKSISTILGGTPITGSGNVNAIPKFTANSVLGNSVMEDDGNFVSMRGLKLNVVAGSGSSINFGQASSISAAGLGYSSIGASGTAGFIFYIDQNTTQRSFIIDVNNINSATTRNYSMPNASGTFALTSDIPSLTGYVPYTGATNNVNLGTYDLLSRSVYIEGTASYQAGLLMKQINGFNFVTGTYTQVVPSGIYDLYVVHNQTNGTRRRYAISVASLQDGDDFQYLVPRQSGTFAMTSDIPSLTGYVQGTGTTNYLPKFTGTSTIGNSAVSDDGTTVTLVSRALSGTSATFSGVITLNSNEPLILNRTNNTSTSNAIRFQTGGNTQWYVGSDSYLQSGTENFGFYNGAYRLIITPSGNLGLGVTPSAWSGVSNVFQYGSSSGSGSIFHSGTNGMFLVSNAFFDGSGYKYINSGTATIFRTFDGEFRFLQAPSGTAGNAISFTQAMTLDASGNLGLGNTSPTIASGYRSFIANGTSGTIIRTQVNGTTAFDIQADPSITYLWENRNYPIAFGTNGTERMRIASGGNVGIGTTSPDNGTLTILKNTSYATENSYAISIQSFSSNAYTTLQLGAADAVDCGVIQTTGKNTSWTSKKLALQPNGGNVGIGTTSPASLLDIASTYPQLTLTRTDNASNPAAAINFSSTSTVRWQIATNSAVGTGFEINQANGSTNRFYINTSGNIGIGTTSPSQKLHVAGVTYTEGIYVAIGTIVAAGSSTTTFHTLPNTSNNTVWLISVRQQGSASNNIMGMAYAINGSSSATRLAYNSSLNMDFTVSGLSLQLVLASGFGTTTWEYTITQIK